MQYLVLTCGLLLIFLTCTIESLFSKHTHTYVIKIKYYFGHMFISYEKEIPYLECLLFVHGSMSPSLLSLAQRLLPITTSSSLNFSPSPHAYSRQHNIYLRTDAINKARFFYRGAQSLLLSDLTSSACCFASGATLLDVISLFALARFLPSGTHLGTITLYSISSLLPRTTLHAFFLC